MDGDRIIVAAKVSTVSQMGARVVSRVGEELPPSRRIGFAEVPMEKKGDQIIEDAVEARAGFLDHRVLLVLVASSILAVAFLVLAFLGVIKL